mgnify:CR=1 FL=1
MRLIPLYPLGLALFILFTAIGCSNNKIVPFPSVRMELGVVSLDGEDDLDSLFLDDGTAYRIVDIKRDYDIDTSFSRPRVLTYMQAQDGEAILHDLVGIPLVFPEPESIESALRPRDPLKPVRVWLGGNFLNLEYGIKAVDLSVHQVTFREYIQQNDESTKVCIAVYHDRADDIEGSTKKHLVSIPLSIYQERINKAFLLEITLPTYDGIKKYTFEIKE